MLFFIVIGLILMYYVFAPYGNWNNAVTLFVALMVQQKVLGYGTEFLGFIDHRIFVSLLILFAANQKSGKTFKFSFKSLDLYKRNAIFLVVLLPIFALRYIEVKNYLLDIDYILLYEPISFGTILKRLFKELFFFITFFIIVKRLYNIETIRSVERGFLIGLAISILSMIFYNELESFGFSLREGIGDDNLRLTGFLGLNANHASSLFGMVYGYILAKFEQDFKMPKNYLAMIGLIIIGLFLTASKTGLIIFVILTLLFTLRNSKKLSKVFVRLLYIFIVFGILFTIYGSYMELRVEEQMSGEQDTFGSRAGYWVLYLNDLIENPSYLIFGNTASPTYYRSVHSTYIEILFFTGMIPFTIMVILFRRLIVNRKLFINNYLYFDPTYSIYALLLSWITGAGLLNYWVLFIIAISAGVFQSKIVKNQF